MYQAQVDTTIANRYQLKQTGPDPTFGGPHGSTVAMIPGQIDAEDFDEGGRGVDFPAASQPNLDAVRVLRGAIVNG